MKTTQNPDLQNTHPLLYAQFTTRVRYIETDGQGRVHHANYAAYFEFARVEMLRAAGISYRELESREILLVVTDLECKYLGAAVFDDLLEITIETTRAKGTRVEHHYKIHRIEETSGDTDPSKFPRTPIVSGRTMVACIGLNGKPKPLPEFLRMENMQK